jgi:hypothetical protein
MQTSNGAGEAGRREDAPESERRRYICVKEACTRWGVGPTKLYSLLGLSDDRCAVPAIRSVKLGRRRLIEVASGDQFISSLSRFGSR